MTNRSPEGASTHVPQDWILRVGTIAAVVLAVIGLASLLAVLFTAAAGAAVWPGFVFLAYTFLPLAFLLLAVMVIAGLARRRRHHAPDRP